MLQDENIFQSKGIQDDELMSYLLASYRDKRIILVYTNVNRTDFFSAGIVSEIFDNEVIINHYLPNGKYDGFIVKQISSIYKVEVESKYVKKIEKLSEIEKAKHDKLRRNKEDSFLLC